MVGFILLSKIVFGVATISKSIYIGFIAVKNVRAWTVSCLVVQLEQIDVSRFETFMWLVLTTPN